MDQKSTERALGLGRLVKCQAQDKRSMQPHVSQNPKHSEMRLPNHASQSRTPPNFLLDGSSGLLFLLSEQCAV